MRDLTQEEMLLVSGGGWWDEMESFFRSIFNSIFGSNTASNPPSISPSTYDNFINACYRAGGTSSITVTNSGASLNAVKVVNADGSYNTVSLQCRR
ncbi:hypothetical protein N4G62_07920 [Sphingomonas sanguinis]|uniref:Uncharacterized protein n=1 Tax=Sphingomonas sanguinis TaxID=33051 RepID=A0ABU5LQF8_9SPHN|nr:hypothetical protein [Sphingomonas sanguinis]MDZ7281951.1 hypothetical protein [Sphingomonas sanguinis]